MAIHLLGFPTNLGLPIPVRRPAPAALRQMGLVQRLRALAPVQDHGDLDVPAGHTLPRGRPLLEAVVAAAWRQAQVVATHGGCEELWVGVGGDHSASLGLALGLHQTGHTFDIVWIDAHGDFNTPATSPSGNPHGMVLALLAGLVPDLLPPAVPPRRMHIRGARSLDPGERELLARHGVHVYGVAEAVTQMDAIAARLGPRVFLSFDLDSLDPAVAPAVHTPEPGGFTLDQVLALVRCIGERCHLLAVDAVEYDPALDPDGRSGRAAVEVLAAATATQARRLQGALALHSPTGAWYTGRR